MSPATLGYNPGVRRLTTRGWVYFAVTGLMLAGVAALLSLVEPTTTTAGTAPQTGATATASGGASPARPAVDRRDVPFAEQIGLTAARQRLGELIPTGRGVVMGHVEGKQDHYLPNRGADRFDGVTFKLRSGPSKPLAHTNHTAGIIYGPQGLAPGVSTVHLFAATHWLTDGYLRTGQPSGPRTEPPRVWTHSWISDGKPGSSDNRALAHVLRRVDYAIDTQGVIMCVGVNNHRTSAVPALLGSAYNVIAVGAENGASSGAYTRIEGEGRCKPDLIAPEAAHQLCHAGGGGMRGKARGSGGQHQASGASRRSAGGHQGGAARRCGEAMELATRKGQAVG